MLRLFFSGNHFSLLISGLGVSRNLNVYCADLDNNQLFYFLMIKNYCHFYSTFQSELQYCHSLTTYWLVLIMIFSKCLFS